MRTLIFFCTALLLAATAAPPVQAAPLVAIWWATIVRDGAARTVELDAAPRALAMPGAWRCTADAPVATSATGGVTRWVLCVGPYDVRIVLQTWCLAGRDPAGRANVAAAELYDTPPATTRTRVSLGCAMGNP